MTSASVEKQKVHRYFESILAIPNEGCSLLSLEQVDRKIYRESGNLYSLFELVVEIRNQQLLSDRPLSIFRRFATLIYCLSSDYHLYFSKIKTLASFWFEACHGQRKSFAHSVRALSISNDATDAFVCSFIRVEYLFHCLRCFNVLSSNYLSHLQKNNFLNKTQREDITTNIEKALSYLRQQISKTQQETHHKILLIMEFCKLLLLVFNIRRQHSKVEKLFRQFFDAVKIIIRLMKKFFSLSIVQYRESIVEILELGMDKFRPFIPFHKLRAFTIILMYMSRDRADKETSYEIPKRRAHKSECKKKALVLVTRLMQSWELHSHSNLRLAGLKPASLINGRSQSKQPNETNTKNRSKQAVCHVYQNTESMKARKTDKVPEKKVISELKKRQSRSFSIGSKAYVSSLQLKTEVKGQGEKYFERLKYLRNRSASESYMQQPRRISLPAKSIKQIQLKIQDYKWGRARRQSQHTRVRLVLARKDPNQATHK